MLRNEIVNRLKKFTDDIAEKLADQTIVIVDERSQNPATRRHRAHVIATDLVVKVLCSL